MLIKILTLFFAWRIGLFFIAFLAVLFIPVFGNRFPYANTVLMPTNLPSWIWGFGNFDGVHYLRIAQNGYDAQFSQAFFPLYPLTIRELNLIPKNANLDTRIYVDPSYFFTGLLLSNIFFLLSLFLFYKLVSLDFNKKTALGSLILLLLYPTSFYFGSIYSESLFLLLVLGTFFAIRKNKFILAGVLGALASVTRVFGLLLVPVFLAEICLKVKNKEINLNSSDLTKAILGILLTPFGALFYMLFLRLNFNDPLYFLTSQPSFGAERSSYSLILLPQVVFRYIKIFTTVPITSQLFFNAFLEFGITLAACICLILFYKRMRVSYLIFTLGCLILPTLTGTLSSMPRYSLMFFSLLPFIYLSAGKYNKLLMVIFVILGIILTSLFVRGYWVA